MRRHSALNRGWAATPGDGIELAESYDGIIRMYDGALRALDTKAQIFLAFLTLTMPGLVGRFQAGGLPMPLRMAEMLLFLITASTFIWCLYPRRGRKGRHLLFDTRRRGAEIAADLAAGVTVDSSATVATLHDIYCQKARSVSLGITLVGVYLVTIAVTILLA